MFGASFARGALLFCLLSDRKKALARCGAVAVAETASWFSALEFSAVGFSAAEGIRKLNRQQIVARKWDETCFCSILRNLPRMPGFPQTISRPCRYRFPPAKSHTCPPACFTMNWPAATSQGLRLYSKKISLRPAATEAKSRAADPKRRTPAVERMVSFSRSIYPSSRSKSEYGNPVTMRLVSKSCMGLTWMGLPLRKAGLPQTAWNFSSMLM